MGIIDTIVNSVKRNQIQDQSYLAYFSHYSNVEDYVFQKPLGKLVEEQPHLRTVVTFLARNVAQLGIHTFERVSETDRQRVRNDPVAMTLQNPNAQMTGYELIERLVSDFATYDEAIWLVVGDLSRPSGWRIQPIPVWWVTKWSGGDIFGPDTMHIRPPGATEDIKVPMENVIRFHGWHPESLSKGMTPITALRQVLAEQIHALIYRDQQWRRAGRFGTVVSRPKEAPTWTAEQKRRFKDALDKKLSAESEDAGGSVILEDGMTASRLGFNAHEDQFVEATKLSVTTVAAAYHVNPTMVGVLDNANFSNMREFRRMLYGETLGPLVAMLEDRINTFLVPKLSLRDNIYVEFNIAEKLQGSFEEQATVISTATGRPWMEANEARARFNLPEHEDGGGLVIPLNVLVGGQSSPQDATPDAIIEGGPSQTNSATVEVKGGGKEGRSVKARAPSTYETAAENILKSFYERQSKSVLSQIGAKARKADDWWDEDRWNRELTDDIFRVALLTAEPVGRAAAEALGFDPEDYDVARTEKFLRKLAEHKAIGINKVTKQDLDESLGDDSDRKPADVFEVAQNQAGIQAAGMITVFSSFGTQEAAEQLVPEGKATKTWRTTSARPRAEHARMDGETVPVGEPFSNGAQYPGDWSLGADGTAGCKCDMEVNRVED